MKNKNTEQSKFEFLYNGSNPIIILIIVSALIYFKNVGFTFSYFDDDLLILNNIGFLKSNISFMEMFKRDIFLNGLSAFYRPLQSTIYFFVVQFTENESASGFFFTNLLFHIATVISLFLLLKELNFSNKLSFLLSLIYTVNPLFVHTVSWIPSSGDLLMCLSSVLTFLFYIKWYKRPDIKLLVFHLLFFAMALLSKESSILLPVVPVLFYLMNRNPKKDIKRQLWLPMIFWAAMILIYFVLRSNYINMDNAEKTFSFMNIFIGLQTIPNLIFKFFIPYNLSPMPRFDIVFSILGLIIFAGILYLVNKQNKLKHQNVVLGLIWLFVFILPTLTFQHGMSFLSYQYLEHRAYLPFVGLIIILAELFRDKYETSRFENIILIAAVLFGLYSYVYSFNYKNPDKFYSRVLKINPNDPVAYYNRGVSRQKSNRMNEAFSDYNQALKIHPDYKIVRNNRGIINATQGRPQAAIEDFNISLTTNPNSSDLYTNRGNAYVLLNQPDKAISDYNMALKINPNDVKALLYRGNVKLMLKQRDEGCTDIRRSAEMGFPPAVELYNKYCK